MLSLQKHVLKNKRDHQLMFCLQVDQKVFKIQALMGQDYHEVILSLFGSCFVRMSPKTIEYRNFKMFDNNNFLGVLDQKLSKGKMYTGKAGKLFVFTSICKIVRDKHNPFKTKKYEEN